MPDNSQPTPASGRISGINIAWRDAEVVFGFSKDNNLTLGITRRYLVATNPIAKVILHDGESGPVAILTRPAEKGFEIIGTVKVPDAVFYSVRQPTAEITEQAGNMIRTYEVAITAPANSPDARITLH